MTSSKTSESNATMNDRFSKKPESCEMDIKAKEANVIEDKCESDVVNKNDSLDVNNTGNTANTNSQYKPMPIKKKHRRGSKRNKRRKYKPYSELTWEEKKAVEERDSRRAVSIRKKYMHEKGRPLAPFNTSQFLMAEHDTKEPDLHVSHHHHHHEPYMLLSSSAEDSDYGESSLSDEEQDIEQARNFLQKDFTETYDRLHSESLHRMKKDELVNEYMQLEEKVENLEKELTVIKTNGVKVDINGSYSPEPNVSTRRKLEEEVEKLREENTRLHQENDLLRPKETMEEDTGGV